MIRPKFKKQAEEAHSIDTVTAEHGVPGPIETSPPTRTKRGVRNALPLLRSWLAYATLPLAGLITAPITARALGPVGRGQLAGILQPMTLAGAVAALGVPSAVTYFVGRGHDSAQVRRHAAVVSSIMTVAVAIALLFYSSKVSISLSVPRSMILLVWTAFLPSAFISIRRSFVQGKRLYSKIDLERTLISVLRTGSILLLWLIGVRGVAAYTTVFMLGGLLASGVLWAPSTRSGAASDAQVKDLKRTQLLRFALFSSFGTIATAMNSRLDQAIMPAAVTALDLGFYSVAVTVAEVTMIITNVISRNVLAEASARAPKRQLARLLILGGGAQVLACGAMLLAIPYLLPLVFGHSFAPAIPMVRILLLATVAAYGADCTSALLSGTGHPEFAAVGPAVGAGSTAVLFWVYWHQMTSVKAAWISVAAQGATFLSGSLFIGFLAVRARGRKRTNDESLGDIRTL